MALDLSLYKGSNRYADAQNSSEIMELSASDDTAVSSVSVVAGKVIKFLLTYKGSDAFNPDYGGTALHTRFIAPAYVAKFTLELREDIENCVKFIHAEDAALNSEDRLDNVYLRDVRYSTKTRDKLDVFLEIVTATGKRASVVLNNKTDIEI